MERLLDGLMEDNVLRGKWAEQIVGHFLGDGVEYAEQWNWFDLRWKGTAVSVKHSVNSTARFDIKTHTMVYDAELGKKRRPKPYATDNPEGWLGHEMAGPQHWCDLYVFAWLPERTSAEAILEPSSWRFLALSRADMYRHFPVAAKAKTVGWRVLEAISGQQFVEGPRLGDLARARLSVPVSEGVVVPDLDLRAREQIQAAMMAGRAQPGSAASQR
jgi:hypothetical protein